MSNLGYQLVYREEDTVYVDSRDFSDCYRETYSLLRAWPENGMMILQVRASSNGKQPNTMRMSHSVFDRFLRAHQVPSIDYLLGHEIEGFACERTNRPRGFL